jgi:hypothetical protein
MGAQSASPFDRQGIGGIGWRVNRGVSMAAVSPAPELVELELEIGTESLSDEEGDWLCASCHNPIAKEQHRFLLEGKGEFAFTNPEGVRFEIITFSQLQGCSTVGSPTSEHTWFPGYCWSYCLCAQCGQQLGWHFSGSHEFDGLIRNRLIRSALLKN